MYDYNNPNYRAKVWSNAKIALLIVTAMVLLSMLFSCQSEQEKTATKLEEAIRKQINDSAFKQNKKVSLLEISAVSYEMIGQGRIDTAQRVAYIRSISAYTNLLESYTDVLRSDNRMIQLSRDIGDKTIVDIRVDAAKKHIKELNEATDSLNYYSHLDSVLVKRIENRKADPKIFYNARYFCKATIGEQNILDTLSMAFNKEFAPVTLNQP